MNFCENCGHGLGESARFCPGCGTAVRMDHAEADSWGETVAFAPPGPVGGPVSGRTPPVPPHASQPVPPSASPSTASQVGQPAGAGYGNSASMPTTPGSASGVGGLRPSATGVQIPSVAVGGRTVPVDLLAVVGGYGLAGLLLLWALRDVFKMLPSLISGLFDSYVFVYAFSYLLLVFVIVALWIVGALWGTAYLLFRRDAVGRWLAVSVAAALFLLAIASDNAPTGFWVAFLLSLGAALAVFLSPGAVAAFRESPRGGRPAAVTAARLLIAFRYSIVLFSGVAGLLGLRFLSTLGVSWLFVVLLQCAAAGLAWRGFAGLSRGPDRQARLLVTVATGLDLLATLISTAMAESGSSSTFSVVFALLVISLIDIMLWVVPSARAWFGDKPLAALQVNASDET